MNTSRVIKFQNDQEKKGGSEISRQRVEESLDGEFLSYESIWQLTDGTSADTDDAMLAKIKNQYGGVLRKSAEIVDKAKADAARIEQDAYQKGYEKGCHDGELAGRERFEAIIDRFTVLLETLQTKSLQIDEVYEQNILELIKAMTNRLVNHEISINPGVIRNCLKSALEFVVENSRIRIHLNPDDYRNVMEFGLNVPGILANDARVQIVEDPNMSAGGCLLSTDYGEVDASVEGRRQALFEAVDQAFSAALNRNGSVDPEQS